MLEFSSSQRPESRRSGTQPLVAHRHLSAFCEAVLELAPPTPESGSILVETLPSILTTFGRCCESGPPLRDEFASWHDRSKRLIHLATLHSSSAADALRTSLDQALRHGDALLDALDLLASRKLAAHCDDNAPALNGAEFRQALAAGEGSRTTPSDGAGTLLHGLLQFCQSIQHLEPGESQHESVLSEMFPSLMLIFASCGPVELATLRGELRSSTVAAEQLVKLAAVHCDAAAADLQRRVERSQASAARVIDALEELHVASMGPAVAEPPAQELARVSDSVHDDDDYEPDCADEATDRDQAEIFYQMAGRCHQRQELAAAERLYSDALRLDPQHRLAWLHRGRIRLLTGKIEPSISDLTRSIQLMEGDHLAHRWRGDAYAVRGRFEEAAADYSRSLELSPDSNVVRYNRAVVLRQAGRLDQSWAELDRLVRQEPRSAPLYLNRGLICLARGQRDAAIREFRTAIVHCPESKEAQDRLKELGAWQSPEPPAAPASAPATAASPTTAPMPAVAETAAASAVSASPQLAVTSGFKPAASDEDLSAKHRTSVFKIVIPPVLDLPASSQPVETIPLRIAPTETAPRTTDESVLSIPDVADDGPRKKPDDEDVFAEFYDKKDSASPKREDSVELPEAMAALDDSPSAVTSVAPPMDSVVGIAAVIPDATVVDVPHAEPNPLGDGMMEVHCPVCGAQSSVRWDRLKKGKILGCPHCKCSFTPLANGRLSEVVKGPDGRWNVPVAKSFRPSRAMISMSVVGLTALLGSVLIAPALLRSSTPTAVELPDDLEGRAKLFGESWLKKDFEVIRRMTFPEQAPKLFAWHRANTAPDRSRNVQINVDITKETPPLAELALRFEGREFENGERKMSITWKEHNKEWLFVPVPKDLSKPNGRPRRGPFGPSPRLSIR